VDLLDGARPPECQPPGEFAWMSVWMNPGRTALTRIPSATTSSASPTVSESMAVSALEPGQPPGIAPSAQHGTH
jgi:hypothetical protein